MQDENGRLDSAGMDVYLRSGHCKAKISALAGRESRMQGRYSFTVPESSSKGELRAFSEEL